MNFDASVFVNCPFDEEFTPLLHAIAFAVHDCGFVFRSALEDVGSGETRLAKIHRLIKSSRWSIHDLSRIELSAGVPRFNMPFECGLAYGAVKFARGKRDMLVMTSTRFSDKKSISDLAGQDVAYHENEPEKLIAEVRKFLAAKVPANQKVRGGDSIWRRFQTFRSELPELIKGQHVSFEEIESLDYLQTWLLSATEWQANVR